MWLRRNKPKPNKCQICNKFGNSRQIQWANINGKYRRIFDDYIALCVKCHVNFDANKRGYIKNQYGIYSRVITP